MLAPCAKRSLQRRIEETALLWTAMDAALNSNAYRPKGGMP